MSLWYNELHISLCLVQSTSLQLQRKSGGYKISMQRGGDSFRGFKVNVGEIEWLIWKWLLQFVEMFVAGAILKYRPRSVCVHLRFIKISTLHFKENILYV